MVTLGESVYCELLNHFQLPDEVREDYPSSLYEESWFFNFNDYWYTAEDFVPIPETLVAVLGKDDVKWHGFMPESWTTGLVIRFFSDESMEPMLEVAHITFEA